MFVINKGKKSYPLFFYESFFPIANLKDIVLAIALFFSYKGYYQVVNKLFYNSFQVDNILALVMQESI